MDEVRKTRLLGIGFDIAARRVFDHAPKKASDDDSQSDDEEVATSATNSRMDNSGFNFYYHGYPQGSI